MGPRRRLRAEARLSQSEHFDFYLVFFLPVLASAGQDGKVFAWSENKETGTWQPTLVNDFGSGQPVWRVSWSTAGGVLAVSDSRGAVSLWKESVDGQWEEVSAPA